MFALSVFITLTLTYFVQTCTFFIWNRLVFPRSYPQSLGDIYFGFLNFQEFTWFLFARTRLTLKYYPKMATILNLFFLMYINVYDYAASMQCLEFVCVVNTLVFVWFMKECEVPAVQKWNPFDVNTPSVGRPRIGYHHVINDTTYGTGLYLWTALMPLRSRSYFTASEAREGDLLSEYNRYFLSYNPARVPGGQ